MEQLERSPWAGLFAREKPIPNPKRLSRKRGESRFNRRQAPLVPRPPEMVIIGPLLAAVAIVASKCGQAWPGLAVDSLGTTAHRVGDMVMAAAHRLHDGRDIPSDGSNRASCTDRRTHHPIGFGVECVTGAKGEAEAECRSHRASGPE